MGRIIRFATVAALTIGCSKQVRPTVPGDTGTPIADVAISAPDGESITVPLKPLYEGLGVRKGSLIRPERGLNPFRLAEDRRRIATYMQSLGRFDAKVSAPAIDRRGEAVSITWTVSEGRAYSIADVAIADAPASLAGELRAMLPFGAGDPVDVNVYRPFRRVLAEKLQSRGYGHARVYSRAYVDRAQKTVNWRYIVDAGPRTVVGAIEIAGTENIPASMIRDRLGIAEGDDYSTAAKKAAELALLDTGAFRTVAIRTNADVLKGPPQHPDTGGAAADRIDAHGDLIARELERAVDLEVVVVEAPSRQLRLEAGLEADPARLDAFAGFETIFRNALGAQNHLTAEATAGYGWRISDPDDPTGAYGDAKVSYLRPGAVGRDGDLRVTGQFRHVLLPTAASREIAVGPGLRRTITPSLFVDIDARYKRSTELGLDLEMDPGDLALSDDAVSEGAELAAQLIYDTRNDRIEATRGRMLSGSASWMPGGALGTHSVVALAADGRQLLGLTDSWSLGLRASGALIASHGDSGVPLGARLFGGGAFGFRGFGRGELSPAVGDELVGGLSLLETSLEARWLPHRGLAGAAAFVDIGGVGTGRNPLADGASGAVGLGARLRSWYVPISIDVSYRLLDRNETVSPIALDSYSLFFRIGEAF